ncbi:MAG: TlpA disulfide reductase family protein [Planctomycetota bacterium]
MLKTLKLINLFIIACVIGLGCGENQDLKPTLPQASKEQDTELKEAPDFTLETLDGELVSLKSASGKVVLLDFWASWCPPCRAEMPHIQKLHNEFKDKGVVIYGINNEDPVKVKRFLETNKYTLAVLSDKDSSVATSYDVSGYPTLVIIGKDGRINENLVGYQEEELLRNKIENLLKH